SHGAVLARPGPAHAPARSRRTGRRRLPGLRRSPEAVARGPTSSPKWNACSKLSRGRCQDGISSLRDQARTVGAGMTEPRRRRAAATEKISRLLDATEEIMLRDGY